MKFAEARERDRCCRQRKIVVLSLKNGEAKRKFVP